MKKVLLFLIIFSFVFAQDEPDEIILKTGKRHLGQFRDIIGSVVLFTPRGMEQENGEYFYQKIPINTIQSLDLSDGSLVVYNGKMVEYEPIEAMAFKDAQERSIAKWNLYIPLVGASAYGVLWAIDEFTPIWGISTMKQVFAISAASLLIPYPILKIGGNKIRYPKSIKTGKGKRTYKNVYTKTLNKRINKMVVGSIALVAIVGGGLFYYFISNLDFGSSDCGAGCGGIVGADIDYP